MLVCNTGKISKRKTQGGSLCVFIIDISALKVIRIPLAGAFYNPGRNLQKSECK